MTEKLDGKIGKPILFLALILAFVVAGVGFVYLKNSYSFTLRADGMCSMRLHSVELSKKSPFTFVYVSPSSHVSEESASAPNTLIVHVFSIEENVSAEVGVSAKDLKSPTVKIIIDDDFLRSAAATGGVSDITFSKAGLNCPSTVSKSGSYK